jgi:glycosyltransferase involved in cell wall biosynthesis
LDVQTYHADLAAHARNHGNKSLCIGYVLSYRDPDYVRSRVLLQALKTLPDVCVVVARNTSKGLWRYIETLLALGNMRAKDSPDIYILGFRGHEIFWPVRWMIGDSPLIFDAFMSPYAALGQENKLHLLGRLLAPLIYRIERRLMQRADLVLTDTQLHADYFAHTFALPETRICALPVGAIEIASSETTSSTPAATVFRVLFYGSFLPLHGIEVIVGAAARLASLPIFFDFIGGTARQAKQLHQLCGRLNIGQYTHRRWVPFEQLVRTEIPRANLCLGGPFGGTPQARRVVTGKTSQCLALRKATVIGAIAEDHGFVDRVNCLLVEQADAVALANSIHWAYQNSALLPGIGERGRAVYDARLSTRVVAERLLPALRSVAIKHQENPQK